MWDEDWVGHFFIGDPFTFISPFAYLVRWENGWIDSKDAVVSDGTEEVTVNALEEIELVEGGLPVCGLGRWDEIGVGSEFSDEIDGFVLTFEERVYFCS